MNDKLKITIEIPYTGLEEDILRKGEWEDDSLFGICLRNALMHFTKESLEQESILDKIRAEIDQYLEIEGVDSEYRHGVKEIIDIIKYRAESEET